MKPHGPSCVGPGVASAPESDRTITRSPVGASPETWCGLVRLPRSTHGMQIRWCMPPGHALVSDFCSCASSACESMLVGTARLVFRGPIHGATFRPRNKRQKIGTNYWFLFFVFCFCAVFWLNNWGPKHESETSPPMNKPHAIPLTPALFLKASFPFAASWGRVQWFMAARRIGMNRVSEMSEVVPCFSCVCTAYRACRNRTGLQVAQQPHWTRRHLREHSNRTVTCVQRGQQNVTRRVRTSRHADVLSHAAFVFAFSLLLLLPLVFGAARLLF